MASTDARFSHRDLAMLRATAAGRAEVICGQRHDLRIDSLPCCDQFTARRLVEHGLIAAAEPGAAGEWVLARLTHAGRCALDGEPGDAVAA